MAALDFNKDKKIDKYEWRVVAMLCSGKNHDHSEDKLRQAFYFFDTQKTNQISIEDFKSVLGNFDEETWEKLIEGADRNKDGFLDFEEFKVMMTEMVKNACIHSHK
jgi:calcium-binding protein CML